jgi:ABC-type Na+ transport system ATPase subunit NatA
MPVAGRHSKVHRFRISLTQREEIAYWVRVLDTTEEQMRRAIEAVGDQALRVREYLDKQRAMAGE